MCKSYLRSKYDLQKLKILLVAFGNGFYLPSLILCGLVLTSCTFRFNRQKFYILPTESIYVFYMYLGTT